MKRSLEIQAVMCPFPHSIGIDQTLKVAKDMLTEHKVRHLPVQDGGVVVGILSERDIHFAVAVDRKSPEEISVEDTYTAEPYIVAPTAQVSDVARRMANDRFGCALVVQNERLLGIFTTVDACRSLAEALSGQYDQ